MRLIGDIALDAEVRAIASGAITDGSSVVVNSDGTVKIVESTSVTDAVGSETVFESANTQYTASTFDTSINKDIICLCFALGITCQEHIKYLEKKTFIKI